MKEKFYFSRYISDNHSGYSTVCRTCSFILKFFKYLQANLKDILMASKITLEYMLGLLSRKSKLERNYIIRKHIPKHLLCKEIAKQTVVSQYINCRLLTQPAGVFRNQMNAFERPTDFAGCSLAIRKIFDHVAFFLPPDISEHLTYFQFMFKI